MPVIASRIITNGTNNNVSNAVRIDRPSAGSASSGPNGSIGSPGSPGASPCDLGLSGRALPENIEVNPSAVCSSMARCSPTR